MESDFAKVLITGGAGFIGSSLIDRMLIQGFEVVCLDNFDSFYARSVKEKNLETALKNKNFELIEGDINNMVDVQRCFEKRKPGTIIHLAAKAGVRPSIMNPGEYFKVNVLGTLNLLEAMRKNRVNRMIFASSSSVYGNNPKVPFSENDTVDNPISPYAASKKSCELLCYNYHHLYQFDIFCLRFFTVYGPRQRPDLAIHKFTDQILNNHTVNMFGNGNTARDYTYIDDILDGVLLAYNCLKGYEVINLGESRVISLNEMIHVLENNLNKKASINVLPTQQGDVEITYADVSKAAKLLGYKPKWDFEKGIREFLKWKNQ